MNERGTSRLSDYASRLRNLLNGSPHDQEFDDEVQQHLKLLVERFIGQGMSQEEAVLAARRQFGNMGTLKEDRRALQTLPSIESLWHDVRYGLRTLGRAPIFTALAILILALGIGANTAIFSVVNAVLLRPLPYLDSERLVKVWETNPRETRWGQWVSFPDYNDYRQRNRVFEELAAFRSASWTMTGGDHADIIRGFRVTSSLFGVLDARPTLGRTFLPDEDRSGANPVAILSDTFWQNRFGGDRKVLGQEVTLDGVRHVVVGIMPSDFKFPVDISEALLLPDIWVPIGSFPEREQRASHNFRVVARLRSGVSVEQGQSDMASIANAIGEENPRHKGRGITLEGLQQTATSEIRPVLLLLLSAIGLVLLIACANIANLQLSRAIARQREVSIRQALGASRGRLLRQLLTESTLIALAGGIFGLVLATLGIKMLVRFGPDIPRLSETTIDPLVLGFTLLLSLLTGILFGLVPALRGSRAAGNTNFNSTVARSTAGTGQARTRNLLVVIEMALALMLLTSAGLLIRSFLHLQNVELGFNPSNLLMANLRAGDETGPTGQVAFFKETLERIESNSRSRGGGRNQRCAIPKCRQRYFPN